MKAYHTALDMIHAAIILCVVMPCAVVLAGLLTLWEVGKAKQNKGRTCK